MDTLPNLHNIVRLRKLDKDERIRYAEDLDFWEASGGLILHDRTAHRQGTVPAQRRLTDATGRHLEANARANAQTAQSSRRRTEIPSIAKEKREKEDALREVRVKQERLAEEPAETIHSRRTCKAPVRFENE
jgi:hypothetical protein